MGFGKNPYVAKAEAAEQKAADAPDEGSRRRALLDAAHEWDRAAEREKAGKARTEYEANAERTRSLAESDGSLHEGDDDDGDDDTTPFGSSSLMH